MDKAKETIRELLDFPALVAESVDLPRSPNGRRATMARCPFHPDDTPSLAVYQDHAHCYGACGRSWDCFGWVMQRDGVDFPAALRECARLAGVTLPDWTPEQQQREQRRQTRADVLTSAMTYYRDQLIRTRHLPDSALRYARSRGWSTRTILRTGALGYAPDDLPGLLRYLGIQGIDPAMALEAGILAKSANGRLYPRFRERLVFPFVRAGRCHYMTGRDLTGRDDVPKWFHLPVSDGDHRPLYGAAGGAGPLVVVESPADALTLWQMGRDAVAVLGTTLPDGVCAALARHRPLYLALDPDPAGERGLHRLGSALGPRCQVVRLPGADINDILMSQGAGDAALTITRCLNQSESYVEHLARSYREATADQQPELLDRFLDAAIALDKKDWAMLQNQLADLSGLGKRQINDLIKAHLDQQPDQDGYVPSLDGSYAVIGGSICQMSQRGPRPIADFSAVIERELRLDDGNEITNEYQIRGATEAGRPLPVARVPAADFGEMGWIDEHWGVSAVIAAGQKSTVATAIKLLSKGAESMTVYTHTGWRTVEGQRVFLHCGGAVGYKGQNPVQVELGRELENYRLPPAPIDRKDDFLTSLRFLDVADPRLTLPIWAAMFQAPISEILSPRMVVWAYGPTNTFKSTLILLAMRHFGQFMVEGDALAWSWTDNAIELAGYMLKDLPLLVDDFAHQPNSYQQKKLQQTAERIIRSTGNEAGRGRMDNKRQRHRTTTSIRALIISTGETLPTVAPSAHSRILPLRFQPGSVNLDRLSDAQAESERYGHAMTGYLLWLRENWEHHKKMMGPWFQKLRSKAREQCPGQTARLADAISRNYAALHLAMQYGESIGAITHEQGKDYREDHWRILLDHAEQQDREVKQEDPVKRFCGLLEELISADKAWLCPVNMDPDIELLARPKTAEKIGWIDQEYYWLIPDVAYTLIHKHAAMSGYPLTFSLREIQERLHEAGILYRKADNRWKVRLQSVESRPWCLVLYRENINSVLG